MVRIFLDTNVLVRYATKDDIKKFVGVMDFFKLVAKGEIIPYLSSVVLLELVFVLKSVYGFTKLEIMDVVSHVVKMRGVVIVDKTDLKLALEYLDKHRVKFSDCLIASSVPKGVKVFSYDDDFRKLKLDLVDPKDFAFKARP